MATTSTWGCRARSRSNSTPVYPVPPTIPTLIIPSFLPGPRDRRAAMLPERQSRFAAALCVHGNAEQRSPASAFRELLAASRLVQAHLLALDFARVARHEPRLREGGLQGGVGFTKRPGNAVAHRSRLARLSAAEDVDLDVEHLGVVGELH